MHATREVWEDGLAEEDGLQSRNGTVSVSAQDRTQYEGTHDEVDSIENLSLEVSSRLGRLDLSNGGLDKVRALGPGRLDADEGLVGGHVRELDAGLGEVLGNSRVHRVDVDGDAGEGMRELVLSHDCCCDL